MALHDERSAARAPGHDLVARVRAGDEAAFEAMFRAYYDPLCHYVAAYLGSRDAAEDAVQGVFVRIWEDRTRWVVSDLRHYLYAAVRRRAISQVRRIAVRRRAAPLLVLDEIGPRTRGQGGEGPLDAAPQLLGLEFRVRERAARAADLVEDKQRCGAPPHGDAPDLADRAATHRGVEVVAQVAHDPARAILPDAHEHSLHRVFGGVATPQIRGDVVAQWVVVGPEPRLQRRLVPGPDAGHEIVPRGPRGGPFVVEGHGVLRFRFPPRVASSGRCAPARDANDLPNAAGHGHQSLSYVTSRAGDGIRTRDVQLGKHTASVVSVPGAVIRAPNRAPRNVASCPTRSEFP